MKLLIVCTILFASSYAKDWWENGNFYQIYPRSFKDSDGDGIGDLNGVTEKLQYIKDIGITGAWLSPIFKSPMADFGYDIADYYEIHPEYGTMEDFEALTRKAKEIGIKIILDFVPNHTSDEHEWFKRSVKRDGIYTNFYIWHDGIPDENNPGGRNKPPNNWVSVFRYSAWEWNEQRGQYYLHQFAIKQPDLNYRDPNVVAEMKNVIRFWLGKGVAGFRIDAVPFMFEVELDGKGTYPDEPISQACPDPDDYCHLSHIYTNDQPETYDMIYQWRQLLEDFKREHGGGTRIILTEAYTSLDNTIRFYESADGTRKGAHIPFNFELISHTNKESSAVDFSNVIDSWLNKMPKDQYPNWVMGNHDNKRLASRYRPSRTDLFNIMLQTLPGNAVTYNGEEIGMTDVFIPWDQTVDPQACNTNENVFDTFSRDPARTPFQWDASKNSGFTRGEDTWLPVSSDYKTKNVLLQERAPVSHLNVFQKLTKLRKEPSFQDIHAFEKKTIGQNIIVYKRQTTGSETYIIVLNFGTQTETIDLSKQFQGIGNQMEVITTSIQSGYVDGQVVQSNQVSAFGEVGTVFVVLQ